MHNKLRKLSKSAPAMLIIILTTVSISCQTTAAEKVTVVEYQYIPLPAITWPVFPDPVGKVDRLPDGRVVMSMDYWLAITHYVIGVETGIAKLEAYSEAADAQR